MSSHAAILLVAAVAFAAGLVGLGQRSDPPAELTYLTPPDSSIARTTNAKEDEEAGAVTSTPTVLEEVAFRTHEVVPGDTLGGIAEKYGVDTQYLLWNNPDLTANPDLLLVGENVLVPGVDGIVYDVRLGDTINAIAATYDIDPLNIVEFAPNELDSPDHIIEGMVLVLPEAVPPPPAEPEPAPPAIDPPGAGPVPAGVAPTIEPALPAGVSYAWPLNGTLWGGFGPRWGSFHKGIDIGGEAGTGVAAAASGQVVLSTYRDNGYGNYIIVRHADGSETLYAHLSERYVVLGQQVSQGEVIGAVGCTGWCTGNHLHFEIIIGGGVVDPLAYLP